LGNKISLNYNAKYSEIFTFFQQDDEHKLTSCVSVALSCYFRCFGLFMPSLFFPSKDGVKAADSDFDRCQLGGGLRPENPSDRYFFRLQLRLYDPCTRTNLSSPKILARYAENEHFLPPIPR